MNLGIPFAASAPKPVGLKPLRAALEMDAPAPDEDAVRNHPLAAWAEDAFGIASEDGRLVRREPRTFEETVADLARESGARRVLCDEKLRALLNAASRSEASEINRPLSFRLHQRLSSGDGVYATLEPAESRSFRMTGQYKTDNDRLLFPLVFCRECGQDYYLARRTVEDGAEIILPRSPLHGGEERDGGGEDGFFCLRSEDLWSGEDGELPDFWFETTRSGVHRVKRGYADALPKGCAAKPDGALNPPDGGGAPGWFQPSPFTLCLRCFAVYERRGSDYGKIASLSQVGRSTAATVAVNAAVFELSGQKMEKNETKALSFTDSRQDASLQAGHLNDFAQVATLRAGVVKAIERNGGRLEFADLGGAVFEALELRPRDFLAESVADGPGHSRGVRAMTDLLEYRALEDLGKGWRVTQPNLEQTGLLRIEYDGLRELAADDGLWSGLPAIDRAKPELRETVLRALLDNLRTQLAINAEPLKPKAIDGLKRRSDALRDPWRLEETDRLTERNAAIMPGANLSEREKRGMGAKRVSLNRRSNIARYLRSRQTWDAPRDLSRSETEELTVGIVNALKGHLLSVERGVGVRLMPNAMVWTAGDGAPPPLDPIRTRAAHLRRGGGETVNRYFWNLYREKATQLRGMEAAEHTGQVVQELREEMEKRFGEGDLPALFCSPTMELGVDIRELRAVHLRNIPPTPANYAQRGGRAGRAGRPALIAAFAANGNAHDQYFFGRRTEMISGAVAPSRMDLKNEDLVRAHFHAIWLSLTGIDLKTSVGDILDLENRDGKYPLLREVKDALDSSLRSRDFNEAVDICRRVARRAEDIHEADWFSDGWIKETIGKAPIRFDEAFDDWRGLYSDALVMRDAARLETDAPKAARSDRREAERRERQALRELEVLRNETRSLGESDFYPYRYLASAGFLPGYNFPRIPARVSTTVRDETQYIGRTRFLSLSEFGPGNLVYHEGRKHRIHSAAPPLSGFEDGFDRARFCRECGCAHFGERADADLCDHCGARLDAENSDILRRLLVQPLMRTRVEERITSEEEARRRNGYKITTHFALSEAWEETVAKTPAGEDVLGILRAPSARLWRVNRGWRRGNENGFSLDPKTGEWRSPSSKKSSPEDISGVMTYAMSFRNLLMLNPTHAGRDESFDLSLMYALKRAAEIIYQVEDNETEAELIGEGDRRRLLFWEEAEGGTGVWERLLDKSDGFREFRELARKALEVCHYDSDGRNMATPGKETCEAACYDCLLTYSNQPEHRRIDRRLLPDFLMKLAEASAEFAPEDDREARFRRLLALTDSALESDFLRFLYESGMRLPDRAQNRPSADVPAQPDFY